jgi:hypothetical protein
MLWIYIIKKKLKNKPLCSVLRSDAKPSWLRSYGAVLPMVRSPWTIGEYGVPVPVPETAGQENYLIT